MVSLTDIAGHLGISVRTVRRALTGQGRVSDETRAKVNTAVQQFGYRPNLVARALRTGRSRDVLVFLRSGDELHMHKMAALEGGLRKAGYSTTILFGISGNSVDELSREMLIRRPAGVVFFPDSLIAGSGLMTRLLSDGIPSVAIDVREEGEEGIHIDRQRGVYEAVRHLVSRGRTRVAYIGHLNDRTRLDGYAKACRELGQEQTIVEATDDPASVRTAVERILAMTPPVDAVQFYSDVLALRGLAVFHALGVKVPERIAVVGFDDRPMASYSWPTLTTVAQPNHEVGKAAAEIILSKMSGRAAVPGRRTASIPTTLVIRESG